MNFQGFRLFSLVLLLLFLALPINGRGDAFTLKSGDVLVQSVGCYICALIEIEEGAPFSHSGVVVVDSEKTFVLEAWGVVAKTPLADFIAKRKAGTRTTVLRPLEELDATEMLSIFYRDFFGKGFDSKYYWEETSSPQEKYYCSEFVAKFLNRFLINPFVPKKMHFDHDRKDWIQYFHGNPPDGAPGLSPSDFYRSPLLHSVGTL